MATRKYTSISYKEYPVADGNYDESRKPIDLIVLHHTACIYQQAIAHFGSPTAGTSAHYIVSNKGEIAAMLEEYYTAYHCGQYATNQRSIGIETEWYEGMGDRTTELYETVSKLVADIAKFYSIPIDSDHVKPHKAYFNTACPGTLDIPRIIDRAKAIANPVPIETPLQSCLRQHGELVKQLDTIKTELALTKQDNITKETIIATLRKDLTDSNNKLKPLEERNKKLETFVQGIKELTLKV